MNSINSNNIGFQPPARNGRAIFEQALKNARIAPAELPKPQTIAIQNEAKPQVNIQISEPKPNEPVKKGSFIDIRV